MLKLQKANIERDLYKSLGEENLKFKAKIAELEAQAQKRVLEMRTLQNELSESSSYKSAYDYMKEEHVKIKSESHLQALELEKLET